MKMHMCIFYEKKPKMNLTFISIDRQLQDILPIFLAHIHYLTYLIKNPILLVEGEDDERSFGSNVVRSSQGRIKLWPCEAGNKATS